LDWSGLTGFCFVDRIGECAPGNRIRGQLTVPPRVPVLSPCLVAEAIGQLAAWAAMAALGFRFRPVAALAAEARFHATPHGGESLDLAVDIDRCDDAMVVYSGSASVRGAPTVELRDCVGAMLRLDDLDDPQTVRRQLEALCTPPQGGGETAASTSLAGARPAVAATPRYREGVSGQWFSEDLYVPQAAPFFADHFPRKPVFPATLLLHEQLSLAVALAQQIWESWANPCIESVREVKLRSFILPGQRVENRAEVVSTTADGVEIRLTASVSGKRVGGARVRLVPQRRA
jgi:3-hydroxymyristoyl/3-hydroxydecanoyl-(acyl carrier protein) dehydratase